MKILKKRNPISFLEESFSSLKEYLDQEINEKPLFFDANFIRNLKQETTQIIAICDELNKDDKFVQKINALVNPNSSKGLLFKSQQFFISDLIALYNLKIENQTEKSRFVLAYYYDALRNNHFADERGISTLNKLVASDEFKLHLEKIRRENIILSFDESQKFCFLTNVLTSIKSSKVPEVKSKFERFMQFSFDLKLDDKIASDFLASNEKPVQNSKVSEVKDEDSLEKVLEELNKLVGLENVKQDVTELINLLEIQKKRSEQGLKNIEITLHTVFLGPPGTGKTTVARLLSRIFRHLGFLSKGQLYETDREGMIAGFVGQTATKVDKAVEESLGGVLFIDEAYALTVNSFGNDYGAEAVNTLLKRMEDHREDLAVVVAGYDEPMKLFIESNPGLRSRFNRFFTFEHFKPEQLMLVFESCCKTSDFVLSDEAKEKLSDTFEILYSKKDEGFGNARVVRNLFEKSVQNQANRIVKIKKITPKILKTLSEEDIPEPKETQDQVFFATNIDENK
jgi:stage V sporulation protein K